MTRPRLTDRIHATTWTSTDHVEAIAFASGYPMEVLIGGVVRVNGVQVGMWGDDVEALAVAAMGVVR